MNEAVDHLKARAAFDTARLLHTCLTDDAKTNISLEINGLGKVNLHVLIREKVGYTVGLVRNGMYITNNLANFGEPFKRFPLYKEFTLLVEPAGPEEGAWFKRLENPSHNDLSAERITDPSMRSQGQKLFETLAGQIRETLRAMAKTEPAGSMELEELNEFFASEETQTEDDLGTETNPRALKPTPIKIAQPKTKRRVTQPRGEDDDDQPGPDPDPNDDTNPHPDSPNRPGPTQRRAKTSDPVDLDKERNVLIDVHKPALRRIIFTSTVDGEVSVGVDASGLSSPDRIAVRTSNIGTVDNGNVRIVCKRGERVTVDVEFDTPYAGPIELNAFRLIPAAEEGVE